MRVRDPEVLLLVASGHPPAPIHIGWRKDEHGVGGGGYVHKASIICLAMGVQELLDQLALDASICNGVDPRVWVPKVPACRMFIMSPAVLATDLRQLEEHIMGRAIRLCCRAWQLMWR